MAEQDLQKWTTFFAESGVPRGPSKEYATLFCNHRITENLLGDLTKDILNDIGITVMGDIMSILKHAKVVHAKLEREKLSNRLGLNEKDKSPGKESPQLPHQIKKKAPVIPQNKFKTEVRPTGVIPKVTKKIQIDSDADNIVMAVDNTGNAPRKRPVKNTLSLSDRFASEKAVPTKIQKSVPKMVDTAHTFRTNKETLKAKKKPQVSQDTKPDLPKRKSAFERLGKELKPPEKETEVEKLKITKLKSPIKSPAASIPVNKGGSSVFNRLGETESPLSGSKINTMTIRTVTGLESRLISGRTDKKYTKSGGVLPPLKPTSTVRPVKTVSPINTTKTTMSSPEKMSYSTEKEKKSVFSRLGSPTY